MFLVPFFWMLCDWALTPLRRLLERRLPNGRLRRFLLQPVDIGRNS
jgi:hypothetical protein